MVPGLVSFAVGTLVGGAALAVAAQFVVYRNRPRDADVGRGVVTALLGALVWALLAWVPLVGGALAFVGWLALVNRRYPGGWLRAAGVGAVAWALSVVVLSVLGLLGLGGLSAVGVPGT